ncbi:MAG: trypsin-like serine protease [Acidimicrobiales bacterium]|nr:trypsin-like serine protease [Acidimicrobiales bacterium]RZV48477.1 MAG: PDZ domain-containing protein [Acidimicrobiales bacterium]
MDEVTRSDSPQDGSPTPPVVAPPTTEPLAASKPTSDTWRAADRPAEAAPFPDVSAPAPAVGGSTDRVTPWGGHIAPTAATTANPPDGPVPTTTGRPVAAAPTPARSITAAAPLPTSPAPQAEEAKRRLWPLALLALATIALSGLLSWAIASNVADSTSVATEPVLDGPAETVSTTIPAASNTITPDNVEPTIGDDNPFSGEPFAEAAAKIAPSVVQLSLQNGLGSGVIIDEDGTILTAAHVVGTATQVEVRLYDGTVLDGTVVGADSFTDVAVVNIDPEGLDLVAAPIADVDDIRVGQLSVAVGSPFGFEQTVTAGIISGVDRVVNDVSMVQTDAPINPGNSGGPLIDLDGRVVGINDLIFTESGSSAGVGFAISIDLATIVADQILAGEDVRLALLGVQTLPSADGQPGALIDSVVPDSAADDGGVEVGDLVVSVDGQATKGGRQLRAQVIDNAPGTSITLGILRQGELIEIDVTLGSSG